MYISFCSLLFAVNIYNSVLEPLSLSAEIGFILFNGWSFPSCHCSIHNSFNQPPAAERRGSFQPFVVTNNAAMSNISLYFDLYAHVIAFIK